MPKKPVTPPGHKRTSPVEKGPNVNQYVRPPSWMGRKLPTGERNLKEQLESGRYDYRITRVPPLHHLGDMFDVSPYPKYREAESREKEL